MQAKNWQLEIEKEIRESEINKQKAAVLREEADQLDPPDAPGDFTCLLCPKCGHDAIHLHEFSFYKRGDDDKADRNVTIHDCHGNKPWITVPWSGEQSHSYIRMSAHCEHECVVDNHGKLPDFIISSVSGYLIFKWDDGKKAAFKR